MTTADIRTSHHPIAFITTGPAKLTLPLTGTIPSSTTDYSTSGNVTVGGFLSVVGNATFQGNASATGSVAGLSPVTVLTLDGAISVNPTSGVWFLEKTSAGAFTIAAPTADGQRFTFIAGTNFAHVITFTGSTLLDGTTGANSTATFGAFIGSSLTVVARSSKWLVESFNVCTIAP